MAVISSGSEACGESWHKGEPTAQLAPRRMRRYAGTVKRGKLRASVLLYPEIVFVLLHNFAKILKILLTINNIIASNVR